MKIEFQNWMKNCEHKSYNTAYQYANSIDAISQYLSHILSKNINLYKIKNINFVIPLIDEFANDFGTNGKYCEFGQKGHGTIRAAINTYTRFLRHKSKEIEKINPQNLTNSLTSTEGVEGNVYEEYKKIEIPLIMVSYLLNVNMGLLKVLFREHCGILEKRSKYTIEEIHTLIRKKFVITEK